ncbi:DUF4810 domain-containing protein [Yersinia aldovae]|uniref:Lipoprotein n=1 Tax=Yersinia aldovae TaxID=29483 RepID=A0A0T9SYE0_YERAL|nr:DUF4810 domain-containing protein [Yersinia aldovae]EEP94841.1 hypothetical protein yaldo0001_13760 [Yersinia aldovae ATCC 35236]CNK13831.1 putative lipoprotein [Yersinia aldovae]CNK42465.1 putative lipoprotein [Yersinia aldovae]CNK48751.1 putative lipoprotein [Yersinia aldovae]
MKLIPKLSLLLAAAVLAGCATAPKPIYNWENYQSTIYEYYKSDASPEQQIAALKENIEKSRAKGIPVPPGLHAHLGMLYANTAHPDLAIAEFNREKAAFPESAPFMDFLMSKDKGAFK